MFQIVYRWTFFFFWMICDVLEEFFGKVTTLEYSDRKDVFLKAQSLGKLILKNEFHKKIVSLSCLTYLFKLCCIHLLNDYYFKMQCNKSFKAFASKHTKLAFDTYLDAQTSPLWYSFHWTWCFRLIKWCYIRNIAQKKVEIQISNFKLITSIASIIQCNN